MRKNIINKIWKNNNAVINGWLAIPNSFSAELMANQNWDSVTIDLQHGINDYSTSISMLQAISTTDTVPLARVPRNEPGIIMKMLDAGVYGLICPMINTKKDCEDFVKSCRYAPLGHRSFGPTRAIIYAGTDYAQYANEEIITMAMIETKEAIDNLDEILSVKGLDAIYVGPADLSLSYGKKPGFDVEESPVYEIIEKIINKAKENKIFAGIHCGSTKYAHKMIGLGYSFVSILSDGRIMSQAVENILTEMKKNNNEKKSSIY